MAVAPDLWAAWRKPAHGLTWRLAQPKDAPALVDLLDQMERRIGVQDRPDFYAAPVLLTLVAEDAAGRIVTAVYAEAVAELTMVGLSREGMLGVAALEEELAGFLFARGFRVARLSIPARLERFMRATLERAHFFCDRRLLNFARLVRR